MMASKSPRNGLEYKNNQASCMWGFINIFEFRIGRSTRKLLADGRHVGSSCSSMKLKMPNSSEKSFKVKIQDDDDDESEAATLDFKTSVKELMDEEMFGEESVKDQRNDVEIEPEAFNSHKGRSHTKKKSKRTYKAHDRSRSMSLSDLDHVKNVGSDDLQIMMEELGQIHLKTNSFRKNDVHTDKTDPVLEEKLSAAIEMLVNQKSKNNRESEEDELMDALQILSSNKELCWKLLQDPNSRLVNHMESIEDRVEKGRKSNSKPKSNLMKKNVALETSNPKQGNFFRRRSKSQESYPLVEDERSHRPSSKIVILKPGPAGLQFPDSPINVSSSVKNSSHFSFTEIKRRLKKAMGKERHGISHEETVHKKQSDIDKGMSGENIGWSSPNRDHFYTERFAMPSPSHFKRGDKKGKPKDTAEINSEQYIKLANENLDIPCELNCNNLLENIVSSTKDEVAVAEILDTEEPAPTGYQGDGKVFDASCKPISFSITTKSGSSDVTEAFNTGSSSPSSELASECLSDSYGAKEVIPLHSSEGGEVEYPQNVMVDRTEQPSPVSVLEPLFPENDINPETTLCQPVELETQPHKIRFEEPAETSLDQQPYTLTFLESEESAFEYVEAVLLGSGLNWDEFLSSWLSSDQILDQSLFHEVDLLSDWSCRKLLFDCTNEVLTEVCDRYFGTSFVKTNIRGIPKGMDLIHEVWIGVEWYLLGTPPSHSLDQFVQKDMAKSAAWMDHKSDLENIGIRIEAAIFEELVEETVLCFANDISEGNLISLAENGMEISIN